MSVFEWFFTATEPLIKFSKSERKMIEDHLIFKSVAKNHKLVDLDDVANELYFVVKGCARIYYITDEGKEITGFVFTENMFCSSLESFLAQIPSIQILQTIEDCDLIVITRENLEQIYQKVPTFNLLVRKVLEQRMVHAQKVVASLIMNKPEDRYRSYQELHPGIEQRISQNVLASFMGITPVSLSRIRGRPKR